jgi:RloB-like protein
MKRRAFRHPKLTVFAFSEAETEEALLKHIRASYGRNTGVSVRIDSAHGKSPETIIDLAIRRSNCIFDRHFILLDTDIPWSKQAINRAKKNGHELIPATPCIEGFLLSLLEPKRDISVLTSEQCKEMFEQKYLSKEEKLDYRNYDKILPLAKLELLRKTNPLLDRIICLMTVKRIR